MRTASIMHKFRNSSVASAIFVVGAGIGWHFADLIFQDETALPSVAAIQFESGRPHEPTGRETVFGPQQRETVHESAPAFSQQSVVGYRQPQTEAVSQQAEEERKLADALQWADNQRRVSEEWEKVAGYQREIQRLAQTQGDQLQQFTVANRKLADAGMARAKELLAVQADAPASLLVKAQIKSAKKHKHTANRRAARSGGQVGRTRGDDARAFICPLQWLDAMLMDLVAESRGGRRNYRS